MRTLVDGIPFKPEVYARGNSVLLAKFGKPSQVVNAHIQFITFFSVISDSNPNKIHEFYEKLIAGV